MGKYQSLAQVITQTYEKNLSLLPLDLQSHFAVRMWRISGQKRYFSSIVRDIENQTKRKGVWIKNLADPNFRKQIAEEMLSQMAPKTPRALEMKRAYQENKEFIFWYRLIRYLFLCKSFGLENLIAGFPQALTVLRGTPWLSLLDRESLFRFIPSKVINIVYYLEFLKVADLEKKLKPELCRFWFKEKISPEWLFLNKIYALTHLLIAASFFYQRFVPVKDFKEVLEFLEKNLEEIIERTNPDIVGEVGLCFRLTKTDSPVIQKTRDYLMASYRPDLGYIPHEGNGGLAGAEHRNAIAILALSDYASFFPGPILVKYFKEDR